MDLLPPISPLRFAIFALLLTLNGLVIAQEREAPYQPHYSPTPCQLELPAKEILAETVSCGFLTVPENRISLRTALRLSVIRLHARATKPANDPIVYLAGGPGGSASSRLDEWLASPLREERDIYLLDQRGTGLSRPSLDCSAAYGGTTYSWTRRCLRILSRRGVDPRQYTSRTSAADIRDLRLALGIAEWNLVGVSYGSRLALTVLRDHPQGIRSVILDSVYPPQADFYGEQPANGARALATLFAACAVDEGCATHYPKLETVFQQTMSALKRQSLLMVLPKIPGEPVTSVFGSADFYANTFRALYSVEDIVQLPLAIYELSVGNTEAFAALISARKARGNAVHDGVYYSVQCAEEAPFTNRATLASKTNIFPPVFRADILRGLRDGLAICDFWPVAPADPKEAKAVYSAIPTLLLAGEFDPITPPSWAARAAETLSNSHLYTLRGIGHGVIRSSDCANKIAQAFLSAPQKEPAHDCLSSLQPPRFVITNHDKPPTTEGN